MADDPHDLAAGIAVCPSTPHRAVLGLVRSALGRPVGPALARDLGASDPQEIVRIATFNYLHVVLETGFDRAPELADAVPRDLMIYLREMRAANQRRNGTLIDQ